MRMKQTFCLVCLIFFISSCTQRRYSHLTFRVSSKQHNHSKQFRQSMHPSTAETPELRDANSRTASFIQSLPKVPLRSTFERPKYISGQIDANIKQGKEIRANAIGVLSKLRQRPLNAKVDQDPIRNKPLNDDFWTAIGYILVIGVLSLLVAAVAWLIGAQFWSSFFIMFIFLGVIVLLGALD